MKGRKPGPSPEIPKNATYEFFLKAVGDTPNIPTYSTYGLFPTPAVGDSPMDRAQKKPAAP